MSENSVIEFHPAQKSEANILVPLIYSSGPAAFDFVFQTKHHTAIDFLHYLYLKENGEFSYNNHIALKVNNRPVGVGAVFTGREMLDFTISIALNIISYYKLDAPGVLLRGLKVEGFIKPPAKNEAAIAHLGIDEKYRGKGLGYKLIDYLLHHPKVKPGIKPVLDVTVVNPAINLYKKMGFVIDKENKSGIADVPNHYRMSLELK